MEYLGMLKCINYYSEGPVVSYRIFAILKRAASTLYSLRMPMLAVECLNQEVTGTPR